MYQEQTPCAGRPRHDTGRSDRESAVEAVLLFPSFCSQAYEYMRTSAPIPGMIGNHGRFLPLASNRPSKRKTILTMKAVILAGGLGTRISEETSIRPKPMVEIGGRPILWHILNIYSQHGITDFIICCGYKGYVIKEYFANYFLHTSDVTFDMHENKMTVHNSVAEPWRVTVVDTGESTGTGGRLRRVARFLDPDAPFCMTYGDGVADVDITASIEFHKAHGKLATLTSVQPVARFGALGLNNTHIYSFREKPADEGGWI